MPTHPEISTADDHLAIGFLTVSYLLGQRNGELGRELRDLVTTEKAERVFPILERLESPQREERVRALKIGAGLLQSALRRCSWERKQ
jgi:hypothetical protein